MLRRTCILLLTLAAALPLAAQDYTIALVGLRHAHTWGHLEHLLKASPAKFVAIAETDPELIAEARKMGATNVAYFTDYKEMLDKVKPTMVWAFLENNRHQEVVEACGPRKIHVIFEKPLAATHKQALAIERLAAKYGIQVMTNFGPAWSPFYYAVKSTLDSGVLGAPWRLHVTTGHGGVFPKSGRSKIFHEWLIDPEKNGAGALMDFGCYNALYALYYLGRPETVYAYALHLRPNDFPKVEDGATMILTYKNAVAILEQSWDLPPGVNGFEILSYKGYIRQAEGKSEMRIGRQAATTLAMKPLDPQRSEPIAYMVNCLRNKRPVEGLVSVKYTVGVNEILDAAMRSIKTAMPVRLK
jgi:predicted dehydrogenase